MCRPEPKPCEVGKTYRIPMVRVGKYFVPILGDLHRDVELAEEWAKAPAEMHWHYDFRFMSEDLLYYCFRTPAFRDFHMGNILLSGRVDSKKRHVGTEVVYRRRKCVREMPIFPVYQGLIAGKLEAIYHNRKIDLANPVCPHKGYPLGEIAPDKSGCVTCPLHGLRWSLETGEMVSRMDEAAAYKGVESS